MASSSTERSLYAGSSGSRAQKPGGIQAFTDDKYRVFKSGQTVVDLGYAPGSWSQVALTRTQPNGRVLGVDIIPSQPPKGVSTIQGNFLDPEVQAYVRDFVRNPRRGRPYSQGMFQKVEDHERTVESVLEASRTGDDLRKSYDGDMDAQRTVDVVLSDMMMNTSGVPLKDHAGRPLPCCSGVQL
ncbi:FtsJ-like methyltransferase-domain-containing protein [Aspergillus recurvatus]